MSLIGPMFAFPADPPAPVIAPAHLDQVTLALWLGVAACGAFFLLRPELWKRLWLERIDPRGPALARIALGITLVWTFVDLTAVGEFLFTDQGLWLTDMARKNYGGQLKTYWDPEHGFEHWWDILHVFESKWTILHVRSDPPFVYAMFGLLFVSGTLMTLGKWTRTMTFVSWVLCNQLYNYSPIFYAGGDTVLRVMMFLGLFLRWGEAYSLDTWQRRRRAILAGAASFPPLRAIPAWPARLMMLQLAIIYCATGLLKSGVTWWVGSALYYAMNLDHFYRYPTTGLVTVLHYTGVLPALTWLVHWWEMLFPLALVGAALVRFERERKTGEWPWAPRWRKWLSWSLFVHVLIIAAWITGLTAYYYYEGKYLGLRDDLLSREQAQWIVTGTVAAVPIVAVGGYHWLRARAPRAHRFLLAWGLGKRSWLGVGFLFHLGIEISMNVGTFVQVMWATYPAWLRGEDVDGFWRYVQSRPAAPGEAGRPSVVTGPAKGRMAALRRTLAPISSRAGRAFAFVRWRTPRPPWKIRHAADERSIRRAALLRCWDLARRLEFVEDAAVPSEQLCVSRPGRVDERLVGADAARQLTRILPGLWPLWPLHRVPGAGRVVSWILHQR
jgi:hypothetical protein